jgi:hypothetical protein
MFHNEKMVIPIIKISVLLYIYFHLISFFSIEYINIFKYSKNAYNNIVTMRVINILHIMFFSIPQLFIIFILLR